ncbi:MAG: acyl carrier protein [Ramlibacter sp.]|jgi:acyl carrier protein|nr:acyl carrier protein [Ramlibacter sp.]
MSQPVIDLLVETFGLKPEQLTPDATLQSLGLDSLSIVEFMFEIEDRYKIKLPDAPEMPATLGEMLALIEPLLPESARKPEGADTGAS